MNKRKNGFTLIEILAVVVMISLICILAIPSIVNSLKNKKGDIDNTTNNMIITATKLYVSDHSFKFDKEEGNVYCLPLTTLTKNEYLETPVKNVTDDKDITDIMSVKISYNEGFSYEVINKKDCKVNITNKKVAYKAYNIGDVVTYNGMNFYVIEASDESRDYVTLLKETPLTVDEVNTYGGVGTDNNHVNMYVKSIETYYQTAYNNNGYGGMQYYSSSTCGYNGSSWVTVECTINYAQSEVKYVVDAWASDKIINSDLTEDETGYSTRLITYDELTMNLGYEKKNGGTISPSTNGETPSWVYNSSYSYWTISPYDAVAEWSVGSDGKVNRNDVRNFDAVVRPVINLYKSAIQ